MVGPLNPETKDEAKKKCNEERWKTLNPRRNDGLVNFTHSTDIIDIAALVSFLFLYFMFNCVYWINYLKV